MLTPEREAEIRKSTYRTDGYYQAACFDLLAEIDRLREESDAMEESYKARIDRLERAIRDELPPLLSRAADPEARQSGERLRAALDEGQE